MIPPRTTAVTATVTDVRRYVLGNGVFLEVEPRDVPAVVADAVAIADDLGGYAGTSTYDVERRSGSGAVDVVASACSTTRTDRNVR